MYCAWRDLASTSRICNNNKILSLPIRWTMEGVYWILRTFCLFWFSWNE